VLGNESGVHAELLVAIDLEQRREGGLGKLRIRSAAAIEPEWLLEAFPERISEHTRWSFDVDARRVIGISELCYDDLVLEAVPARVASRKTRVCYPSDGSPNVESWLQDFSETPMARRSRQVNQPPSTSMICPVRRWSDCCYDLFRGRIVTPAPG